MADYKLATNAKTDPRASSAAPAVKDFESDLRGDVAAIKEDVVRLAQHLNTNKSHLVEDAKKTLEEQMQKAKSLGKDYVKQIEDRVQEKPTQSILIAFGAGLIASILLARR